MASVLDGVKVLDLSSGIAGPVAGMLLADHGADIVKVEPPGGDPLRGTPGYDAWIRGRRSAELDLKDVGDRATFLALASRRRRGPRIVLARHHESARHRRRDLARREPSAGVLLDHRIRHPSGAPRPPGLGRAGRRPPRPAARAARSSRWRGAAHERRRAVPARTWRSPRAWSRGRRGRDRSSPTRPGRAWRAAFLATVGINAALLARERTGRGQHVETSLLQAAFSLTASKWQRAEHNDPPGYRTWIYDRRAPKGFFRCSDDRWVEQWVPEPALRALERRR